MDKYNIPWTFVFGNHEADYQKIEKSLNTILKTKTKNLYFHKGPKLSDNNTHGNSNFILKITNNNKPILNLYLFDSKASNWWNYWWKIFMIIYQLNKFPGIKKMSKKIT